MSRVTPEKEAWLKEQSTFTNAEVNRLLDRAESAERSLAEARDLVDRLRLEAQMHAQESHTQAAIVKECYQIATGATGEPGDWHGSEPVRRAFEALKRERDTAREKLVRLSETLDLAKAREEKTSLMLSAQVRAWESQGRNLYETSEKLAKVVEALVPILDGRRWVQRESTGVILSAYKRAVHAALAAAKGEPQLCGDGTPADPGTKEQHG